MAKVFRTEIERQAAGKQGCTSTLCLCLAALAVATAILALAALLRPLGGSTLHLRVGGQVLTVTLSKGGNASAAAAAAAGNPATPVSQPDAAQHTEQAAAAGGDGSQGGNREPPAEQAGQQAAAAAEAEAAGQGGATAPGGDAAPGPRPVVRDKGGALSTRGLPCEASGYCSLGVSKVWTGDVATNEALRDMLQAVTYKKELIFALSNFKGYHTEMVLNLVKSAEALGYGHTVVLAPDAAACAVAPPQLGVSCVWDSSPIVETFELYDNYYRRWALFGRVARMGYNILSLDADVMLAHDVYSFFNTEPLSRYNLITQDDGGGVNCGVVRMQNAHPSGPAVWAAVEHPYRTTRQRENETHMQSMYPGWSMSRDTWEQPFWNLVIGSVTAGMPFHQLQVTPEDWKAENGGFGMQSRLAHRQIDWPPAWHNITGEKSSNFVFVDNLTLPLVGRADGGAWWEAHRGYFYPPQPGSVSSRYLKLIEESSPEPFYKMGEPWQAAAIPEEGFAYLPLWFAMGYVYRGVKGYWHTHPPAQVVLHNVWDPAKFGEWKLYNFKGAGLFHWEVPEAIYADRGGNVLGLPDPRLFMLAPGVQLFAESEDAFVSAVKQLTRLAGMMGRRLVFPNPPCDSMWVGIHPNAPHPWLNLFRYLYDGWHVLQFYDTMRPPFNRTYCHYLNSLGADCRAVATPHADAVAFLDRWPQREQAAPSERNTLWHAEWQAAGGAAGPPPGLPKAILSPLPEVGVPSAAAVVEAAAAFADWPVLFLGAVPRLESEDGLGPMGQEQKGCFLFADEPPHFEPVAAAGENRQRWLNGTL